MLMMFIYCVSGADPDQFVSTVAWVYVTSVVSCVPNSVMYKCD